MPTFWSQTPRINGLRFFFARIDEDGLRVIYYVRRPKGVIWMLTIYPKNMTESIPGHVLKQIREEIEGD